MNPPPPTAERADRVLLEGPHSRLGELRLVAGALLDFLRGFRALHFVGPCVTVFGSARFPEGHAYYALGRDVGRRLVELGFTVMTGGGPGALGGGNPRARAAGGRGGGAGGLMEAANRGAREAGERSVGCNIALPAEQRPNAYLDRVVTCRHFFVRKVMLFKYSYGFVALRSEEHT